ncbi:MAG: ATP-binding protein [Halobacteriaceae archaeon]
MPSEIALLDSEGTILYTNQQWQEFGRENDLEPPGTDNIGDNYIDVTRQANDEYAQKTVKRLRDLISGDTQHFTLEYPCHSPDQKRWFRMSTHLLDHNDDQYIVMEHLDITDRKLAELEIKEKNQRLEGLHAAAQELLQSDSHQEVATLTIETIQDVLDMPVVGVFFYESDKDVLSPVAVTEEAKATIEKIPTYSSGESLSWEAFQTNSTHVFDDLRNAPKQYNTETPIRSEIILPMNQYGVLNIGSTETNAFDEMDVTLAEIWVDTTVQVLRRLDHERQLQEREQEVKRERDRLENFASLVSHDLRNPLNVAEGRLTLATEECDSEHLEEVDKALDRMNELIDDLLTLALQGESVTETEAVYLPTLIEECEKTVESTTKSVHIETNLTVRADRSRLAELFENLFRNAAEHGGNNVEIVVGDLEDRHGFFIADNGPGIPSGERDQVFESGYSSKDNGTGFGLAIVKEIVDAHGWEISVTESEEGGAKFDIKNVDVVE